MRRARVALVHDYLTQRGGAERVLLAMMARFPSAPIYTSIFASSKTFPEFREANVTTTWLDRDMFRHDHRRALPFLSSAFETLAVDAEVAICSSSGWAHGVRATGKKLVYCHTPARWLYLRDQYLGNRPNAFNALGLAILSRSLKRWDQRKAAEADKYLTQSSAIQKRIADIYGIEAEVVPGPHTIDPTGTQRSVEGLRPGYLLCVSRLLPYKNVDAIIVAMRHLTDLKLVIVGDGPERGRLSAVSGPNVAFLGVTSDEELRWLYANSRCLLAAAHEDYGLTPLEAAAFGTPVAVLRKGGFVDTVVQDVTGIFFDRETPDSIADAVTRLLGREWDRYAIRRHAANYTVDKFGRKLEHHVSALLNKAPVSDAG